VAVHAEGGSTVAAAAITAEIIMERSASCRHFVMKSPAAQREGTDQAPE
jgi:hypothetical protein